MRLYWLDPFLLTQEVIYWTEAWEVAILGRVWHWERSYMYVIPLGVFNLLENTWKIPLKIFDYLVNSKETTYLSLRDHNKFFLVKKWDHKTIYFSSEDGMWWLEYFLSRNIVIQYLRAIWKQTPQKSGLKWQDLNQSVHFQTFHVQKPWGKFPINSSEVGKNIILNNNTRVLPVLSSQFPTCSSSAGLKVNHNSFCGRYSIHWKWSAFPREAQPSF